MSTGSAGSRYKEITASMTDAVDRMREHERQRASSLEESVARAEERLAEADQQRDEIRQAADFRWSSAMEALWNERWLTVGRRPEPDTSVHDVSAADRSKEMQRAFVALHEVLTAPKWGAKWNASPWRRKG